MQSSEQPSPPSLRERTKARRRELIRRTGMRLFAERGYEHTTIADIAAEAEVAPRTVTMYFSSKVDIALSAVSEFAGRLAEVFREHPEFSFTDAVDTWLLGEQDHPDPELAKLTNAMFETNPGLRSLSSGALADVAVLAGPAFAAEVGLPPGHPLARVVGSAVGSALSNYLAVPQPDPEHPTLRADFMHWLRATLHAAAPR